MFAVMAFFRIVDYVFLMAYDYTSVDSDKTGLLAPMQAIVSNEVLFYVWTREIYY